MGTRPSSEVVCILLAMLVPGGAMYLSFYALPPQWTALVYTLSKLIVIGLPLWIVWSGNGRHHGRVPIRESFRRLPKPTVEDVFIGMTVGAAIGAATLAIYFGQLRGRPEFNSAAAALQEKMAAAHVTTPLRFVLVAVFISLGNSTLEEYFWRWFAFGRLRRYWRPALAAVVTCTLFGLHHFVVLSKYFPDNWILAALPLSFGTVLGGLIWCYLYQRRGTLYAAWLSHFLIDVAVMAIGYDLLW